MSATQQIPAKRRIFSSPQIAGIVLVAVIIQGLIIDTTRADSDNFYNDIMRLDNVTTKIHQNYVEDVRSKDLVDKAVEGMIQILDPHTSYFEKKQYEELRIHTEGKFGGLGIQISIRDNVLTVMTPIPGTPAARAGIQSGDQILSIDGKPTKGIKLDDAVDKLRGEPGTDVTIRIRRKGEAKDIDYTITREVIRIKSVPFAGVLDKKIGYIRLNTFSQEASDEIEKSAKVLLKSDIRGLVLDLRHNPGGLLPEAINVASKFLPRKSLVVSTRGRAAGQNKEFEVTSNPVYPLDLPLVVLVDYASASASEIVAGAIQDWDRGVILGDTTFGKGSVQSILPLDNTHHLKLTTAFYYTPSGRCINKPENAIRGADSSAMNEEEGYDPEVPDGIKPDRAQPPPDDSLKPAAGQRDTTVYRTKSGRIVRGGGGIIPDTIVVPLIPGQYLRALFAKDVFFKFANVVEPRLKKQRVTIDRSFQVSDELMKEFRAFLDTIHFEFKTYSQAGFDMFKTDAGIAKDTSTDSAVLAARLIERPQWQPEEVNELRQLAEKVDRLLKEERIRRANVSDADVRKYIKQALLLRVYGQEDELMYRERVADDAQLVAAIALLSDRRDAYENLLKARSPQK